jgi:hypothetical protein
VEASPKERPGLLQGEDESSDEPIEVPRKEAASLLGPSGREPTVDLDLYQQIAGGKG